MKYFYFLVFTLILSTSNLVAQKNSSDNDSKLIINLLIDANQDIMVENKRVSFEEVSREVRKIIYAAPAFKYNGVEYRVFGDVSLNLGVIIDVEDEMFKAFNDESTSRKRYLLNIQKSKLDNPNWTSKIQNLDLKAIEQ